MGGPRTNWRPLSCDSIAEYVFKESHVNITEKLLGEPSRAIYTRGGGILFSFLNRAEPSTDVCNVCDM